MVSSRWYKTAIHFPWSIWPDAVGHAATTFGTYTQCTFVNSRYWNKTAHLVLDLIIWCNIEIIRLRYLHFLADSIWSKKRIVIHVYSAVLIRGCIFVEIRWEGQHARCCSSHIKIILTYLIWIKHCGRWSAIFTWSIEAAGYRWT